MKFTSMLLSKKLLNAVSWSVASHSWKTGVLCSGSWRQKALCIMPHNTPKAGVLWHDSM